MLSSYVQLVQYPLPKRMQRWHLVCNHSEHAAAGCSAVISAKSKCWVCGGMVPILNSCVEDQSTHTHTWFWQLCSNTLSNLSQVKNTNDEQFADNVLNTMFCRFCIFLMAVWHLLSSKWRKPFVIVVLVVGRNIIVVAVIAAAATVCCTEVGAR